MKLRKMIRLYLAAENTTQEQASKQIGIDESTLSRFLNDKGDPNSAATGKIIAWAIAENPWATAIRTVEEPK